MQKIIIARQVGPNKYRRHVKIVLGKDELVALIAETIAIAYIIIRSLL